MAATVQPFVSCYWQNPDGSITVAIGYTNSSANTLTYPVGPLNYVTPAPQDRGQPTVFLAGTHNNVWAPTISQADLSRVPTGSSTATASAPLSARCQRAPPSQCRFRAGPVVLSASVLSRSCWVRPFTAGRSGRVLDAERRWRLHFITLGLCAGPRVLGLGARPTRQS